MSEASRNKRVLIFTNHFYPENFKVNDIAFFLAEKNMDITVVTSIPNYPTREKYKTDYTLFKKRNELLNNVKVIRLPLIPRASGKKMRLLFTYISFSITSILYSIYLGFFKKFDVVFVHHTSPVFIGIPAIIVKKLQGIKIYFWNLDLWPEVFSAATKIRKKWIFNALLKITILIQKQADVMLIGSKGYKKFMLERGVKEENIVYFPNWAETIFFNEPEIQELPFEMPKGFNVVFAGNLGEAQDLGNIFKAIRIFSGCFFLSSIE